IHVPRYPFPLSQAEAACFLSHRAAWEAIVDDGVDAGLVLEDDAMITPDFDGAFELARSTATPGSFIRFPYRDGREAGLTLRQEGRYRVLVPSPVGLGMVAQLVTREAALRLLSRTAQFDRPVDTFVQMLSLHGALPL